eukprot:6196622-Pleurochrysis_carterae.AAC.1
MAEAQLPQIQWEAYDQACGEKTLLADGSADPAHTRISVIRDAIHGADKNDAPESCAWDGQLISVVVTGEGRCGRASGRVSEASELLRKPRQTASDLVVVHSAVGCSRSTARPRTLARRARLI